MLGLAHENGKLARLSKLRKLEEAGARSGFFEPAQHAAVLRRLPEDLCCACAVMHTFGWRRSEVLSLERRELDLKAGTLSLDPGLDEEWRRPRVYLTPELRGLLAAQVERVKALERRLSRVIPSLFPHLPGPKRRALALAMWPCSASRAAISAA